MILVDVFLVVNLVGVIFIVCFEDLEVYFGDGSVFIVYIDNGFGGDGYLDFRVFVVSKYFADVNVV